jgi:hypothetical protein
VSECVRLFLLRRSTPSSTDAETFSPTRIPLRTPPQTRERVQLQASLHRRIVRLLDNARGGPAEQADGLPRKSRRRPLLGRNCHPSLRSASPSPPRRSHPHRVRTWGRSGRCAVSGLRCSRPSRPPLGTGWARQRLARLYLGSPPRPRESGRAWGLPGAPQRRRSLSFPQGRPAPLSRH